MTGRRMIQAVDAAVQDFADWCAEEGEVPKRQVKWERATGDIHVADVTVGEAAVSGLAAVGDPEDCLGIVLALIPVSGGEGGWYCVALKAT